METLMIGILGPNKIDEYCKLVGLEREEYIKKIKEIANSLISRYEAVLVPDKGSVSELFASEFKGKKIGIIPLDDKEFGCDWLNLDIVDEKINCGTWRNQPEKLDEECDVLLCLGFTPGSLIEICYTKWFKVDKILVIKDFISEELPKEINSKLNIKYISLDELKNVF